MHRAWKILERYVQWEVGGFKHMAAVLADYRKPLFGTGRKGGGGNSRHGEEGGWGQFSPPLEKRL